MVFFGIDCVMEDGFNNFLVIFCVSELKWMKYMVLNVIVVFWISFIIVRFFGIFLVWIFKFIKLIFFLIVFMIIGFVGFFI